MGYEYKSRNRQSERSRKPWATNTNQEIVNLNVVISRGLQIHFTHAYIKTEKGGNSYGT